MSTVSTAITMSRLSPGGPYRVFIQCLGEPVGATEEVLDLMLGVLYGPDAAPQFKALVDEVGLRAEESRLTDYQVHQLSALVGACRSGLLAARV